MNTKEMVVYWYNVYLNNKGYWTYSSHPTRFYPKQAACQDAVTVINQLGFTLDQASDLKDDMEKENQDMADWLASL